jgi:hypothetical protein
VFEIPEDLLNCHPRRRAWVSLKTRTKAHGELNVRPCRREVQEVANHAPILSLVNSLVIFIWTQCGSHADSRMRPDLPRGTGKSIGGDPDIDDECSEQRQFEPVQSLHHDSVGYQPVHT